MKKIIFFDTKSYDEEWFNDQNNGEFEIKYIEHKLDSDTAYMAKGFDAVCAFVNDDISADTINALYENGISVIAMRCAGFNNVDLKEAYGKLHILRVPAYSPYAVAEHAMALLLTLNRKIHKAYNRTRENNFSIRGLAGFDLYGKTVGVVGTGKIGKVFVNICKGFGMKVLATDPYPAEGLDVEYVPIEELCRKSDIISLHSPLTEETRHMINKDLLSIMKKGVYIINTSRGLLVDSDDLLEAIKKEKIGGAALDVYEEEADLFFEDNSSRILQDDVLARLISMPNVIVTSHQAFFTKEALRNIARVTLDNLKDYFEGKELKNEVCYKCIQE